MCAQGGDGAPSTRKPALCFPVRSCCVKRRGARQAGPRVCAPVVSRVYGLVCTALGCGSDLFSPSGQLLAPGACAQACRRGGPEGFLALAGGHAAGREAGLVGKAASGGAGRPCVFAAVPLPGKESSNCLNATLAPCPPHPTPTIRNSEEREGGRGHHDHSSSRVHSCESPPLLHPQPGLPWFLGNSCPLSPQS